MIPVWIWAATAPSKTFPKILAKASIRCDIVKVENQIPLSLLQQLEDIAHDQDIDVKLLKYLLFDNGWQKASMQYMGMGF